MSIQRNVRLGLVLFACISVAGAGFAYNNSMESQIMFSKQQKYKDNLKGVDFAERKQMEDLAVYLTGQSSNAYEASMPLTASAELGVDAGAYRKSLSVMKDELQALNDSSADYPDFMRSNAFKAWMWGRVLLATKAYGDADETLNAKENLVSLLGKDKGQADPFFVWAWGYRAALSQQEYQISKDKMMSGARLLSRKGLAEPDNHDAVSNAVWAWVMNICAAANAQDKKTYQEIKDGLMKLTNQNSVASAINVGLTRTDVSSDYPAWALAKVRFAAVIMQDIELYQDIEGLLATSIEGIKGVNTSSAKNEYVLAVLENELAKLAGKDLTPANKPSF